MSIQLTLAGLRGFPTAAGAEATLAEFGRQHCLLLRDFLAPDLLTEILDRIDASNFEDRTHLGIGTEQAIADPGTLGVLAFAVNRRNLFDALERITGCGRIGCFVGRVYRLDPTAGHYDSWHDDAVSRPETDGSIAFRHRLLAMSINLSSQNYAGGALLIREKGTRRMLHAVRNTGLGDALIFRIAPHLEHRVAAVEGGVPRTAYAGWFYEEPDWEQLLRSLPGGSLMREPGMVRE